MFSQSAEFYDLLYAWKDYEREADTLRSVIASATPAARTLLDVACGTGRHLELLRDSFTLTGVEVEPTMLEVARRRLPGVELVEGDMRSFALGRRFDVVMCLFGSVGYLPSAADLSAAIANMAGHLDAGGVLIVEPFLSPDRFKADHLSRPLTAETDQLTVVRMNGHRRKGERVVLEMHYLVARPGTVEHFVEEHEMSLFTDADFEAAFAAAGLTPRHDPEGLMGRGLWVATSGAAA